MLSIFYQEHLGTSKSQVGKSGQKTQTKMFSLPSGSCFFLKYFINTHYPFLLMDGSVCLVNEKPEINVQNSCVLKVGMLACIAAIGTKLEEKC